MRWRRKQSGFAIFEILGSLSLLLLVLIFVSKSLPVKPKGIDKFRYFLSGVVLKCRSHSECLNVGDAIATLTLNNLEKIFTIESERIFYDQVKKQDLDMSFSEFSVKNLQFHTFKNAYKSDKARIHDNNLDDKTIADNKLEFGNNAFPAFKLKFDFQSDKNQIQKWEAFVDQFSQITFNRIK